MTLKLIDKDLRSKYAEALYKNEASFEKEIDRRYQRLYVDYNRSSQIVDSGSQVFLNRVRQKRNKWSQDDTRFREHYRFICSKVHNKKLDNLKNCFDDESNNFRQQDPITEYKFELLQQQLKCKDMKLTFVSDLNSCADQAPATQTSKQSEIIYSEDRLSKIPKLPPIGVKADINELYCRYSTSDREFLDKFPAKVELTVTDVGKQYILQEKQRHLTLKRQKQKYARIQDNALKDVRYKNLVTYLNQ